MLSDYIEKPKTVEAKLGGGECDVRSCKLLVIVFQGSHVANLMTDLVTSHEILWEVL
jgi:hypothetical protein